MTNRDALIVRLAVIEEVMEEYKDCRWTKRELNIQKWLDKYPQYENEIKEAIEDYEFSLQARGLDKVIKDSKSADELWKELLPKLKEVKKQQE